MAQPPFLWNFHIPYKYLNQINRKIHPTLTLQNFTIRMVDGKTNEYLSLPKSKDLLV
ncbi:hypothetical protein FDUTEX481_08864 [Tolypothrix sp. PCC 7601]|nr:hypothetical protein FDUTEX481_08864 [Tolypothrix sp. PCC 7601]